MSNEIAILIGTLGGSFIGAFFAFLGSWLNKRSEERKHLRQLIITAAVESWKQSCENLKLVRGNITFSPVDDYIIHMTKFADVIIDKNFDASGIEEKLAEISAITQKVHMFRVKEEKEEAH